MNNTKNQHPVKRIAIVAYDDNQKNLIEWSFFNRQILQQHELTALGTNSRLLQGTLGIHITALPAPAAAGYQELAQLIRNEKKDNRLYGLNNQLLSPIQAVG